MNIDILSIDGLGHIGKDPLEWAHMGQGSWIFDTRSHVSRILHSDIHQ